MNLPSFNLGVTEKRIVAQDKPWTSMDRFKLAVAAAFAPFEPAQFESPTEPKLSASQIADLRVQWALGALKRFGTSIYLSGRIATDQRVTTDAIVGMVLGRQPESSGSRRSE